MTNDSQAGHSPAGHSPSGQGSRGSTSPLALLRRHRNFRLFYVGQTMSLIGTQMQILGQAWLVLILSRDPLVLGLVTAAQAAPIVGLALFGGALADRLPKRRMILAVQSVMMGLALLLGLLALTHVVTIWQVVLIAFALGCARAIEFPARQSFFIEMVGREDLPRAVALNASIYQSGVLVGPAVAGVAIGIATQVSGNQMTGVAIAFLANGVSFVAVLAALLMMRESELFVTPRKAKPGGVRVLLGEMGEGVRYVLRTPSIRLVLVVAGLVAMVGMNFNVLVPVLARGDLASGAEGLGFLLSAVGLGSLVSALWIGMGGAAGVTAIAAGAGILGVSEVVLSGTGGMLPAAICMFLVGAGATMVRVGASTVIQLSCSPDLRGRTMSTFGMTFEGVSPIIGGVLAGGLAGSLGARGAFLVTGGTAVALILLALPALLRLRAVHRVRGYVMASAAVPIVVAVAVPIAAQSEGAPLDAGEGS